MNIVAGCRVLETLHEDPKTIIYRAVRDTDAGEQAGEQNVVVKTLRAEYPLLEDVAQLRHEYHITRALDLPGVLQALELVNSQNGVALLLEDFGGVSLHDFQQNNFSDSGLDFDTFFSLALGLTQTIGAVHARGVIHKDIKPDNIFIHPQTRQLKLGDFGIASQLASETPLAASPQRMQGTLAYMSPEQTGRMNQPVDYRSDFYSLGITFYQLLTGHLPFEANDAMEIVHSHLAKTPPAPQEIRPDLPPILGAIILKLLAKTAQERYQSANGLMADLQECQQQWQAKNAIETFELARHDSSDKLHISTKIYGRESEISALLDAFERAANGGREMVLVAGYSGIGKTSIVNEVHKPIAERHGWFAAGKFDQFRRDAPYTAIIQAFRALIRQVLTESEENLARFKAELLQAFGPNGQLLIEVIPEIELIVGPQPPVASLGPQETLNRFNFVLSQFVRVWAQAEHPLVLFLDDLQWAGDASLKLLQILITDRQNHHLLIVGAYRDNEVSPSHPLMLTLDQIGKSGLTPQIIALGALPQGCIEQLLEDSLRCSPEQSRPLAALLVQRTAGNPFFLNQLLKSLHEKKLLKRENGRWRWDLDAIGAANLTGNVVELMAGKIQNLPPATQDVLKLAACIGNRFDARTLATVRETSVAQIANALGEALRAGLISPLSGAYQTLHLNDDAESVDDITYKFLHDRVQQAAYSLVSEDERSALHLEIGRLLLEHGSEQERDEQLFDIVGHLNEARALITQSDERHRLVRLNLTAGLKAKVSAAYGTAIEYFDIAQEIAPESLWHDDYETMFALARERSESEYLQSNFGQAETQFELALSHARNALDRAAIKTIRVSLYTTRNDYERAIRVGLEGLAALDLRMSPNPSQLTVMRALLTAKRLQGRRAIADIIHLPHLSDPRLLAQMELLSAMTPALYLNNSQSLFALANLQIVNISLRHGNALWSAHGFSLYAVLLASALGDARKGFAFGEMAMRLAEQFDGLAEQCKANFSMGCYLLHHLRPLRESAAPLEECYRMGLEAGNTIYAGYSIMNMLSHMAMRGMELSEQDATTEKYLSFFQDAPDSDQLAMTLLSRQLGRNLRGQTNERFSLSDDSFDESVVRTAIREDKHAASTQCHYYITKARQHYFWGDYPVALEMARHAQRMSSSLLATPYVPENNFFHSLTLAALYSQTSEKEKAVYWKQLRKNQKQMKKWATDSPANYQHKYLLVAAEMARLQGKNHQAAMLYDEAIRSAHDAEYTQNEALANEIAARFYEGKDRTKLARAYWDEARYGYEKWGATAKVAALDEVHAPQAAPETFDHHRTTDSSLRDKTSALDLSTVIKAAQAISGEIDLGRLLQQLLRFALENAGATRGALILRRDDQLLVEAVGAIGESELSLPAQLLEECGNYLPLAVVQYVARTRENLVLSDAGREGLFTTDEYVIKHRARSILCAPIVHQTKLNGLIYLENHLVPGAFTPERLQVLAVLSAQAAISLQNARLYQQLKDYSRTLQQRVNERTEELRAKNGQLEQTLSELQAMQERVIVQEKMASLGALTAGIAHEIKNPLNFVNNFALLSVDLADELREEIEKLQENLDEETCKYLQEIMGDLQGNAQKISEHGKRADSIVRGMLLHSRGQAGELEATDINALVHEAVQLAYHGQRAQNANFNISIEENYEPDLGKVRVLPHEISRVVLNLANNACYAANQKAEHLKTDSNNGEEFSPTLFVATQIVGDSVEIRVRDNGDGIPEAARKSIFTPFFTTKPTGEGTGLGLSMSYEIVVQQHGGEMSFQSQDDEGTEFIVKLPYQKNAVL